VQLVHGLHQVSCKRCSSKMDRADSRKGEHDGTQMEVHAG